MTGTSPIERSDRLKAPPVVGEYYLVPSILFRWGGEFYGPGRMWWPVWGRKHTDREHFNFVLPHYHVDPRFMSDRHWQSVGLFWDRENALKTVQRSPISSRVLPDGPPVPPSLRRMKCTRAHAEWSFADKHPVISLNEHHAGQQCRKGKRGFVCPHKLFPLGSIEAVDGVVTCPLHGLRVDAETGVCLGPKPKAARRKLDGAEHNGMPRRSL